MDRIKNYFMLIWSLVVSVVLHFSFLYGDASISGEVTEFTSAHAIEGIKVILRHSFAQETETDAKGFYQFLNVPSGQYKIEVQLASGYVSATENPFLVNIETSDIKADFSLGIPGNIVGCVIDSLTNLPVAHATIEMMRGNKIFCSVLTDENGVYSITGVLPRAYVVRVRMPGFQTSLQLVTPLSNQTKTIDFALEHPPGKIIGQVVNAVTGQPIHNATIHILENNLLLDSVQTDENGAYLLSEVASNHYAIRVVAANFQTVNQNVVVLNSQVLMTNVALEPYGKVIGQIVHAFTGQPITGACVGMWQNDELVGSTPTDVNGYFSFNGLGNCQLVVQALQFHGLVKDVEIAPMQTSLLNFQLISLEPKPPAKLMAKIIYKRILHQINRTHCLKWIASRDPSVKSYYIYRNEKYIAEISADAELVFNDEWRSEKEKTYQVTAVNHFGQESKPISITIK